MCVVQCHWASLYVTKTISFALVCYGYDRAMADAVAWEFAARDVDAEAGSGNASDDEHSGGHGLGNARTVLFLFSAFAVGGRAL